MASSNTLGYLRKLVLSGTFSGDGSSLANTVTTRNYVYAFDTTTQTPTTANAFQAVTFAAASVSGWTYSGGTFTCGQSGLYFVEYDAEAESGITSPVTILLRAANLTLNYANPNTIASITLSTAYQPGPISKSFLAFFDAGNQLQIQLCATSTQGGLTSVSGGPSVSCTIIRIQ